MKMNFILPLRAIQATLSIVVLGLMAYVSSWWSTHWRQSSPSEINYLIFAPAWSLLTLIPLILVPLKFSHLTESKAGRWALVGAEGLVVVFWFAGFVALAVFLSGRICFGMVCDVARASTAISAVSWLSWMVTFAFGVVGAVKGGNVASFGKKGMASEKVDMHQGV